MQENSLSRTALSTAFMRSTHQIPDTPPLLFEDRLALPLLSCQEMEAILRECGFHRIDFLTPETTAARYYAPHRDDLPAPRRTSIVWAAR